MDKINVKTGRDSSYDIIIDDSFSFLKDALKELYPINDRKVCIISDTNVGPLYLDQVKESLNDVFSACTDISFNAGEASKNLDTIKCFYEHLIKERFGRNDVLIALGGGVTGDMCGFTAATFLRGVDYIQIPTSLLSQVDSSIGGKTGVDFDSYKNMIGAFKMPELVYINTSTLKSLPGREFASGMGEVLKSALIRDGAFYEWLINSFNEINDRESSYLKEMIGKCVDIKRVIVEQDPFEKGIRAILNFGHTCGHAIEKYMDFRYTHGECVCLGIIAAAYISWKRDMISMEDFYEIRDMFVPFDLPISLDELDTDEIIRLTKSDKKASSDGLKFILLKKIGKAVIAKDVTDDEIKAALLQLVVEWE